MDRGAWWATINEVTKSQTQLSNFTFTFSLSCIGEGNDNPLQCSCLENPRDRGAWWADVYRVAQSRTRLKWLSSSSSSRSFGPPWLIITSLSPPPLNALLTIPTASPRLQGFSPAWLWGLFTSELHCSVILSICQCWFLKRQPGNTSMISSLLIFSFILQKKGKSKGN